VQSFCFCRLYRLIFVQEESDLWPLNFLDGVICYYGEVGPTSWLISDLGSNHLAI
jgi:hypothetical protein